MVKMSLRSVGFELSKEENIFMLEEIVRTGVFGVFHTTVKEIDDETNLLTVYYDTDFIVYDEVVQIVKTIVEIMDRVRG